jgi:hypothetical protein
MSWEAPRALRRYVRPKRFARLAEAVNELLAWPRWGIEEVI